MEAYKVMAPTRADLAGGTLDLWPLYNFVGEARTINIALSMHAIALFEINSAAAFAMEMKSPTGETFTMHEPLNADQLARIPGSLKFPVAIASEYIRQKHKLPKASVKIEIQAEAPLRSGLGGSSTLCVALVRGLARMYGDYMEQGWQWQMLKWVKDLESQYLHTPTGTQDYLAALFGGLQCYHSRIGAVENIPYPESVFEAVSDRVVMLFSGEMHHSGISNWELFKSAVEGKKEIIQGLTSIKAVAEHLDGELRSGHLSWRHIGQHLTEEWRIRRELFGVHTKRLDEIIDFLAHKKVLGAKVCGAAAGGSILALVEPSQKAELARQCTENGIQVLRSGCSKRGVTISVE